MMTGVMLAAATDEAVKTAEEEDAEDEDDAGAGDGEDDLRDDG